MMLCIPAIIRVLRDIMVHCASCDREVKVHLNVDV